MQFTNRIFNYHEINDIIRVIIMKTETVRRVGNLVKIQSCPATVRGVISLQSFTKKRNNHELSRSAACFLYP